MAPSVTITRGPRRRSCSGTTIRSNSERPILGFWICAATVCPPLERRIASAGIATLRPHAITRSGQGGRKFAPVSPIARNGKNQSCGGSHAQGKRIPRHFWIYGNPVASARPSAWLAIPALPSCKTQATGEQPLGASGDQGASVGATDIASVYAKRFYAARLPL